MPVFKARRVVAWLALCVMAACGGTAVVESGNNGVNNPCRTDSDCVNGACLGGPEGRACASYCQGAYDCAAGQACDTCATSSCPTCDDCVGACVSDNLTQCNNHGDCGPTKLCSFAAHVCLPACDFDPGCPEGYICDSCGTSSCPDCDDCRSICLPLPE